MDNEKVMNGAGIVEQGFPLWPQFAKRPSGIYGSLSQTER
jgi:hypothetical protein